MRLGLATLVAIACGSSTNDVVGRTAAGGIGRTDLQLRCARPPRLVHGRAGGRHRRRDANPGVDLQRHGRAVVRAQSAGGGAFAIVNTNANKCVNVQARGTADGTKIQLYDCNQTSAQSFVVQDAGGGFVSFVNTNSGKCLDVAGDNPADGTVVQLYDCNGTNAQRWNPTVIGGAPSGGTTAIAPCDAAQLAACNCPSTFSCCPTDGELLPVGGPDCLHDVQERSVERLFDERGCADTDANPDPYANPDPHANPEPTPNPNGTRTFTFVNQCSYDVWVGGEGNPISPATPCSAGCPAGSVCNTANQLCTFEVPSASIGSSRGGQSMALTLPPSWGGRFWPRTECTTANGQTTCATGDCGGNLAARSAWGERLRRRSRSSR